MRKTKYHIDDYFIHKATGNVWKIIKVFQSEYIKKQPEYHLQCVKDKYNTIDYPYIPAMESNLDQFYELSPSAKVLYNGEKVEQRMIGFVDYKFGSIDYSQAEIVIAQVQDLLKKR